MSSDLADTLEIAKALHASDLEKMRNYRFILWISILGPKTSYREFRLHHVDDFEIWSLFGFKLFLRGDELLEGLSAFEMSRNVFVSAKTANAEEWKSWVDSIIQNKKPRVILKETLRNSLALPNNMADVDILVLSIIKLET